MNAIAYDRNLDRLESLERRMRQQHAKFVNATTVAQADEAQREYNRLKGQRDAIEQALQGK